MIYDNICQLIGKTPLIRLHFADMAIKADIIAKVEFFNPAGSIKDRPAYYMIEKAEEQGILKSGGTIIEPTSGNTGVGLAMISAIKGYRVILTMPESMSIERRNLLKAYGAEIELTSAAEGMSGAIKRAEELHKQIKNSVILGQFDNPYNAEAHYITTAQEILADTKGQLDILVATIGTGGTITGLAKGLKEYKPDLQVIGVEPLQSAVLNGRPAGSHKIQGIGAGFVPQILDQSLLDEVIMIDENDALRVGRSLAQSQGILAGISSGAAVCAAIEVAKRSENHHKRIIVILPDTGERYLSTELFND